MTVPATANGHQNFLLKHFKLWTKENFKETCPKERTNLAILVVCADDFVWSANISFRKCETCEHDELEYAFFSLARYVCAFVWYLRSFLDSFFISHLHCNGMRSTRVFSIIKNRNFIQQTHDFIVHTLMLSTKATPIKKSINEFELLPCI